MFSIYPSPGCYWSSNDVPSLVSQLICKIDKFNDISNPLDDLQAHKHQVKTFNHPYVLSMVHQGCRYWEGQGTIPPPNLNSETKKIQQFQFQTSGIIIFTSIQNLYDFYHVCYKILIIYGGIPFFLTTQGKQINSCWTFKKVRQ